ncbi:hypothetical protein FA13DRAFT_682559 [Coprinellus micaceus]|uniref:F-box domain-containing protein n=1 Tax=Coprinellus micaceus TaxID=71717 RepID=A0A4Y7T4A0_COPMI|nr:hypothetical protein FA13DRAFT_682559 [Coprinellus micaceus]
MLKYGRQGRQQSDPRRRVEGVEVPEEILQQIFWFASFDRTGKRDPLLLPRACRVDRQWRQAAMSYAPLWAVLPPIHLDDPQEGDLCRIRDATSLYLTRSGVLPITFNLKCEREFGPPSDGIVIRIIELLVDECERWESIDVRFCMRWFSYLFPPTELRLPLLSRLELRALTYPWRFTSTGMDEVFMRAPNLRHIVSNLRWVDHNAELTQGPIKLVFPWTLLETVTCVSPRDEVYDEIMESPAAKMHSLTYATQVFRQLPRTPPPVLPDLTVLRLRAGVFICDVFSHLSSLLLPALTHLEIWGGMNPRTHDAYRKTSAMVRRSGCSLQRVALSPSTGDDDEGFLRLLRLCPHLESLDIPLPEPNSNILQALVLNPSSPTPTVPKLRVLGLHYHLLSMPDTFDLRVGYDITLVEVVQSRAPSKGLLEEVSLVWDNTLVLHGIFFHQDSEFNVIDGRVDAQVAKRLVHNMRSTLHWHFKEAISWRLYENRRLALMWNMNRVMLSLEVLSLEKINTSHLMIWLALRVPVCPPSRQRSTSWPNIRR